MMKAKILRQMYNRGSKMLEPHSILHKQTHTRMHTTLGMCIRLCVSSVVVALLIRFYLICMPIWFYIVFLCCLMTYISFMNISVHV